jgi:hypothetical protein
MKKGFRRLTYLVLCGAFVTSDGRYMPLSYVLEPSEKLVLKKFPVQSSTASVCNILP